MSGLKSRPISEAHQSKNRQRQKRGFWSADGYIPTHDDETIMDGAPDRFGLVEENRQPQMQMQLQLRGRVQRILVVFVIGAV
jgi:hypothetical protein